MLLKFKKTLYIDKVLFQAGVQDVPEEKARHPHCVRYIKFGLIIEPEGKDLDAKDETPADRAKRLIAREKELQAKKEELLKKVEPSKDETPADDEKADAAPEEGKKKSKKG